MFDSQKIEFDSLMVTFDIRFFHLHGQILSKSIIEDRRVRAASLYLFSIFLSFSLLQWQEQFLLGLECMSLSW